MRTEMIESQINNKTAHIDKNAFKNISLGLAFVLSLGVMASVPAAHASMDVLFDYRDPQQSVGSGEDRRNVYSRGASNVAVSGWQSRTVNRTFSNRTHRLRTYSDGGLALDNKEYGWENLIDNRYGLDLIIFEFDTPVALEEVRMGYVGWDFDFTLLAHTGGSAPVLENKGFSYNASNHSKRLLNQGWELVGHYDNYNRDTRVNSGGIASSTWALGAYVSVLSNASRTFGWPDQGDDFFALKSLSGQRIAAVVSEPGVMALFAIALGGLLWRRRRASAL